MSNLNLKSVFIFLNENITASNNNNNEGNIWYIRTVCSDCCFVYPGNRDDLELREALQEQLRNEPRTCRSLEFQRVNKKNLFYAFPFYSYAWTCTCRQKVLEARGSAYERMT